MMLTRFFCSPACCRYLKVRLSHSTQDFALPGIRNCLIPVFHFHLNDTEHPIPSARNILIVFIIMMMMLRRRVKIFIIMVMVMKLRMNGMVVLVILYLYSYQERKEGDTGGEPAKQTTIWISPDNCLISAIYVSTTIYITDVLLISQTDA